MDASRVVWKAALKVVPKAAQMDSLKAEKRAARLVGQWAAQKVESMADTKVVMKVAHLAEMKAAP